ncbi:hypothetical protein DSM3645_04820 [Blastopirellula marina DSM 3645]|uniref:Uncharacterized protein n=1 Tax=Blastopirellula marina DSM 3645 TaxID=314230 RepID=A4A1N8_9BACT|nr:hypothetical protein DSM3645_04820 [Blastopirellula marina DSM 3645]
MMVESIAVSLHPLYVTGAIGWLDFRGLRRC